MKKKLMSALLNLILAKDKLEFISTYYHYPREIQDEIEEKVCFIYQKIWWIEDILEAGLV